MNFQRFFWTPYLVGLNFLARGQWVWEPLVYCNVIYVNNILQIQLNSGLHSA